MRHVFSSEGITTNDLDALFKLPLDEFTTARNALAARLKKAGRQEEADQVKSLRKPSSSAWAVNQLYWNHRGAFNRLMATAQRFGQAQASQLANKAADLRNALTERRETISELTRLAAALLRDSGHNAAPDTIRRITATLEALSTGSSTIETTRAGRLTEDIGPPGFESLEALAPAAGKQERVRESTRVIPFKPRAGVAARKQQEAKTALQNAERVLHDTQKMAQDVATALNEATAHADEMEKIRLEAEERFEHARSAAIEARHRLQKVTAEATKAAKLLENAQRALAKAQEDVENFED